MMIETRLREGVERFKIVNELKDLFYERTGEGISRYALSARVRRKRRHLIHSGKANAT